MSGRSADKRPVVDREATPEHWATVEKNCGLVYAYLQRHPFYRSAPQADFDDAVQDGMFGLLRAVQLHDPAKGTLGTVSHHWIARFVEEGRERFEGVNYRRSVRYGGGEYTVPLSLDAQRGEDTDLASLLVAPDDLTLRRFVAMSAELASISRDNTDRWAALCLLDEADRNAAAEQCGCSRETIRKRIERLRSLLDPELVSA